VGASTRERVVGVAAIIIDRERLDRPIPNLRESHAQRDW
jgi:hypothetical protein